MSLARAQEAAKSSAGLTGVWRSSTSVGDLNGDADLDLVVTGLDPSNNGIAKVYLGDGNGGFTEAGADLTGVRLGSTSLGDINGDGNLDLVVTGEDANERPTATVYLGDGNGGFTEAEAGLTGVRKSSTSLGDIDKDGNLDLVVTGENVNDDNTATVYVGDGSGAFTEAGADLPGVASGSTSLGDIDGDGNLDLVVTGASGNISSPWVGGVYLGDGRGDFDQAGANLTGVINSSTSLGKIYGGDMDLVLTGRDANQDPITKMYLGDGSGGLSEPPPPNDLTGVKSGSTSLGDVNGDGNLDLVLTGYDAEDNPIAKVYLGDEYYGFTEVGSK